MPFRPIRKAHRWCEAPPGFGNYGTFRRDRVEASGGRIAYGYAHFRKPGIVLLLQVWAKNEKDDLSRAERDAIALALKRFERLIRLGVVR